MKKLLLGTTGLIAAAMFADAAAAQTPKVTVGGFADFQAGFVDEDLDQNQRSHGFRNDTEISVRVDGKSSSGLGYGAVIDLEADVTADANNEGRNAARTFLYLDGVWGRFELGSNEGPTETLRVDASTIAAATGGIDGSWVFFASNGGGNFISTPAMPLDHGLTTVLGDESTENANKITYYSPRYSGFQLGLAYQPDAGDRGQTVTRADNDPLGSGENILAALNYEEQFGGMSVGGSLSGQFGSGESANTEDLNSYSAGLSLGYAGFTLAGSYTDWDDSLSTGNVEGDLYTVGAAYNYGAFGASVGWMDSSLETNAGDNDFSNLVIGADYQLAPGLTPYAEASFYEFEEDATAAADNEGTVVILGTQLSF